MEIPEIILQIFVAALAVIGGYSLWREILRDVIYSREITVAVILDRTVDEGTLELLLNEATRHPGRRRGRRVALVLPEADPKAARSALPPYYQTVTEHYGAQIFFCTPDEPNTKET